MTLETLNSLFPIYRRPPKLDVNPVVDSGRIGGVKREGQPLVTRAKHFDSAPAHGSVTASARPNLLAAPQPTRPPPVQLAAPPATIGPEFNPQQGPLDMSAASQVANAANAQLSTGPRTEEGKRQSSQNARTHGLTAQHPVIPDQDRAAFHELRAQLQAETKPQGALQQIIFDELVHSAWNLRRVRAMEAELDASAPDALLSDGPSDAKLDRLARHHTRIERAFFRSLRELKALQTDAAISLTLPSYFMKIAPPLASRSQIAKRTQFLAINDRVLEADDYHSAEELEACALGRVLHHQSLAAAAEPTELVMSAH